MRTYTLPHLPLHVTRLAYGCMGIGGSWNRNPVNEEERTAAFRAIEAALGAGINFFDHADIYCIGKSEQVFGAYLKAHPALRDSLVIQSKCGIRFGDDPTPGLPGRYDFSYEYIVGSAEGILRRLGITTLDILLLHRPDPLVEPEEVAKAFDHLQSMGKVRWFGVSNHNAGQIALLQNYLDQSLVVNQLEVNLLHHYLFSDGVLANQTANPGYGAAGTLDYCRLHNILVQAWSPVAVGRLFTPPADAEPRVLAAAQAVAKMAAEKGVPAEAVALAWLLRHPAGIQPVIGTVRPERIRASAQADQVDLTREEWYTLFTAGLGMSVP